MIQTPLYYKNSGSIPPLAMVLIFVVGTVVTWLLALVYAYAIAEIPFVYISFLLTYFFGKGIGLTVNWLGKRGKARNTNFMINAAVILTLFGLYACWAIWFNAIAGRTDYFLWPGEVIGLIQVIAKTGAWSVFDSTPTGGALYGVWAAEALIIFIGALRAVISKSRDTPFCEECNEWADDKVTIGPFTSITDKKAFTDQIEQRAFQAITELKILPSVYRKFSRIVLLRCPNCEQGNRFLTVMNIKIDLDQNDNKTEIEKVVFRNLIISAQEYDLLLNYPYMVEGEEDESTGNEGSATT